MSFDLQPAREEREAPRQDAVGEETDRVKTAWEESVRQESIEPETAEEESPEEGHQPLTWLVVVLLMALVMGWYYVEHGDLGSAWEEASRWMFWILVLAPWLLSLLLRFWSGESGQKGLEEEARAGGMPDNEPIRPR